MFVLKCKYKTHDKPFDIVYIENDGWNYSVDQTFTDLKPK